ncbi:MAG: acyl carrier protein [Bacteroidales bacterium]|nr:acyl carrier protein [Bacteroidales bacterium]MBP5614260.1 acyl carrier protein [Bacteroidales bacterium]
MDTIFARVQRVIAGKLGVSEENVTLESDFIKDLGADSLDVAELVMLFENEFSVEIPDSEMEKVKTVGDVVSYLEQHSK